MDTNIHLWSKNGTKAQLFRIIKSGDDCYTFLSSLNYHYCIEVNKGEAKNGTNDNYMKEIIQMLRNLN